MMQKIRAKITKGEEIRYISHLDYASALERSIRRAGLPAAYSEGFNPHMKIAFASALAVGVTSEAEYMDVELKEPMDAQEFAEKLRAFLPAGIRLHHAAEAAVKSPSLMASVDLADYEIRFPFSGDSAALSRAVEAYNDAAQAVYLRVTPKSKKEIEIKRYMHAPVAVERQDETALLKMKIEITPSGSVKPGEVMRVLIAQFGLPVREAEFLIHRKGLYAAGKSPMEL